MPSDDQLLAWYPGNRNQQCKNLRAVIGTNWILVHRRLMAGAVSNAINEIDMPVGDFVSGTQPVPPIMADAW